MGAKRVSNVDEHVVMCFRYQTTHTLYAMIGFEIYINVIMRH